VGEKKRRIENNSGYKLERSHQLFSEEIFTIFKKLSEIFIESETRILKICILEK